MSERRGFQIRFFGILSILVAVLVLMYGATFRGDPEVSSILLTATVMLGIGLTFGVLMTGTTFKFRDMRVVETLLWTGASFGMILLLQRIVPLTFEITAPISPRLLGVLVGVAEECFFRVFLCGVGSIMAGDIGGIIGSSAGWSAYHIPRYGDNLTILFIIFLVGCGLGLIYLKTKFADGVIFGHALVNYVAMS